MTATFADTTTTSTTAPTCSGGGKFHKDSVLTTAEQAELKAAHDAALAANPSLQTQETALKQQFATLKADGKGTTTKAQWEALHTQASAFHSQLRAAELGINPGLSSVFAKLDAAPKHHWNHSADTSANP